MINSMKCLLVMGLLALAGCAATPTRPNNASGIVYNKGEARVQKAAVGALLANGFVIGRSDTDYVDGSRPHKIGLVVGSGGESAAVWLSPLGPGRTAVKVSTAKSLLGILGQKNWDAEIIAEMDKSIGPHEGGGAAAMTMDSPAEPQSEPTTGTVAAAASPDAPSAQAPLDDTAAMTQAQGIASQLGCGAVQSQGGSTFVAPCGTYGVLIDCYDGKCHAMHTVGIKGNE
ncbi:hypothetical protein [Rhodanobacter sp. DHB23]|uniref:hypothetical protein n=1 Tax=Rhodanobacter sp. DHB23 TaxID=2775923 RepID=UPI001784E583|nr:hypothetical protein [Rhodanobacter sp. DHB23]MBD8874357.1 hypothetical protein [Rhodanobacter sp. DHB23]